MSPRRVLRTYETGRAARTFAQGFDYARTGNALPLLVVEPGAEGRWHVINSDIHAKPNPWREPGSRA